MFHLTLQPKKKDVLSWTNWTKVQSKKLKSLFSFLHKDNILWMRILNVNKLLSYIKPILKFMDIPVTIEHTACHLSNLCGLTETPYFHCEGNCEWEAQHSALFDSHWLRQCNRHMSDSLISKACRICWLPQNILWQQIFETQAQTWQTGRCSL